MSPLEGVALGVIIGLAIVFIGRRAMSSIRGEKGSCRSCGDHCSCVIQESMSKNSD
ncbi:hypothetical protein QPK87_18435 [Kamptonema cortianum]|nr:hypothetical protein [Geitlerinema splendidum]MDK3158535.1 hypothetical protein [Kamptonema cortianum]